MKRILHFTGTLNRAGTETFIMNLYRRMISYGYQFDFLLTTSIREGGFYEEVLNMGAKIYSIPPRRSGFFKQCREMDSFFKNHASEYDAIHLSACTLTEIKALRFAKKYGIPIRVMHIHSSSATGIHNKIFHFFNRLRISKFATHLFACGKEAGIFGYGKRKFKVITNGIDVDCFDYNLIERDNLRKQLGIDNAIVIGHVGRLNIVKNHSFIIDIVKLMRERGLNVKALFIGEGEFEDSLKRKVKDLHLENDVIFAGPKSDVAPYYQAFDIVVFPSLFEGLPFVLVEAQTSGLPIVASTNVPKECNLTGNVSFLSLDTPISQWADEILACCSEKRKSCKEEIIKAGFSIENTAQYIAKVYDGKEN